ncbi:hypothetical protein ACLMJK_000884 [Lecanora helva]
MFTEWPFAGTHRTLSNGSTSLEHLSFSASAIHPSTSIVNQPSSPSHSAKLQSSNSLKRSRSEDETSRDESSGPKRKKRRLRLDLVTSRLSRPYADPATHIIGTKAWRLGPWARQRFAGGKLLRKAAVFNQIVMKRKRESSNRREIREGRSKTSQLSLSCSTQESRQRQPSPIQPTVPLISSTYDAFDYEHYEFDSEDEDEKENDKERDSEGDNYAIHSDFRLLDSSDTDPEFFDTSWSFIDTEDTELDPSESEIRLVMENERKDEVSVAPTRYDVLPSSGISISVM